MFNVTAIQKLNGCHINNAGYVLANSCAVWLILLLFLFLQSLVIPEKFQHILRIMNTNIDGKRKVTIAMTAIKGVGRRYANIVLKKADVDLTKRAGECTEEEVIKTVIFYWLKIHECMVIYCCTILSYVLHFFCFVGRQNCHYHLKSTPI